MANKRIGILTGGGDVPGLNSVIKSVTYSATSTGKYDVIGIRRGWKGLTHTNVQDGQDPDYVIPLTRQVTRTIDRTGGTFLHTSRTKPSKMPVDALPDHAKPLLAKCKEVKPGIVDATPIVADNLTKLGVDYLLAIGGDDTLSYAAELEQYGFPVVAVPKTMDNDVQGTEYCIGFSTALTRATAAINRQRTTIGSHERVGIFRIFGRDAGYTALYTAYVTSTRCCIPEYPFDLDKLLDLLADDKKNNPSNYSIVILSEGATWQGRDVEEYGAADMFGHRKKVNVGEALSDEVKAKKGLETVVSDLTYDLRGGAPDFLDKMIANTFANMAFECIESGETGNMMAIQRGCYALAPIPDPAKGARRVEVDTMYNVERYRPNYANKRGLPIFLTQV